jgi:hypothetical protein
MGLENQILIKKNSNKAELEQPYTVIISVIVFLLMKKLSYL